MADHCFWSVLLLITSDSVREQMKPVEDQPAWSAPSLSHCQMNLADLPLVTADCKHAALGHFHQLQEDTPVHAALEAFKMCIEC